MNRRPFSVASAPADVQLYGDFREEGVSPDLLNFTDLAQRASTPYSEGAITMLGGQTPMPQQGSRRAHLLVPDRELDDETLRTRRYWQRWGRQAARELLKGVHKEKMEDEERQHREELVISAKCAGYNKKSCDDTKSDTGSEKTGISLFSLTTYRNNIEQQQNLKVSSTAKTKKKSKKGDEQTQKKPNWEKFARQKRGLLFDMMARDADQLHGVVKGLRGAKEELEDIMSPEEKNLLHECAFERGIKGREKSMSTANVLSLLPKPSRQKHRKGHSRCRCRTPSPSRIANAARKNDLRPESAIAAVNLEQTDQPMFVPAKRDRTYTMSSVRSQRSIPLSKKSHQCMGMPDVEGALNRRVKSKLHRTYSALERITGYGDSRSRITQTTDEKGKYTEADYAKHARYPQNIRICPQLSQVIRDETQRRMGRPVRQELKERDVLLHSQMSSSEVRSHRNLIIFNWLNNIDESNYDDDAVPQIACDDGGRPVTGRVYPQLYTEVTMTAEDYSRLDLSRCSRKFIDSTLERYGSEGSDAFSVSSTETNDRLDYRY